ncbi:hypothetical protein A3Q56_00726 [Intoshia linei]|uniref:Phosphatidylinositol N-acetylglucosaminyltransferase subunit Q n=1 Tax=Intoshia linei TaxID=1819745 RepID=A0A177BDB4_9BILA|nr:hypothetical protein A3Q56_00726 [Intoshia linei]
MYQIYISLTVLNYINSGLNKETILIGFYRENTLHILPIQYSNDPFWKNLNLKFCKKFNQHIKLIKIKFKNTNESFLYVNHLKLKIILETKYPFIKKVHYKEDKFNLDLFSDYSTNIFVYRESIFLNRFKIFNCPKHHSDQCLEIYLKEFNYLSFFLFKYFKININKLNDSNGEKSKQEQTAAKMQTPSKKENVLTILNGISKFFYSFTHNYNLYVQFNKCTCFVERLNIILQISIDIFFGSLFYILLSYSNYEKYIFSNLYTSMQILEYYIIKVVDNIIKSDQIAGLKLNSELTHFFGIITKYQIGFQNYIYVNTLYYFVNYFKYLSLSCFIGLSFYVSLWRDVISLAFFSINSLYFIMCMIYYCFIKTMQHMCLLFLGKKRNPLRNRVDSLESSQYKLLMGTLIFTISLFLIPTIVVFYVLVIFARLYFLIIDSQILLAIEKLLRRIKIGNIVLYIFSPNYLNGKFVLRNKSFSQDLRIYEIINQKPSFLSIVRHKKKNILTKLASCIFSMLTGKPLHRLNYYT